MNKEPLAVEEISTKYQLAADNGGLRKGYKQTEVGVIPEDWDVKPLMDYATIISDGIHATPKYVRDSDFFFVNGNNLVNDEIAVTAATMCVSEAEYKSLKKPLTDRTLLFSINGTIGNLAFYKGEKVVLGKSAAFINIIKDSSKEYIAYCLKSQTSFLFFENELTGTTIRNLSLRSLKNTPIPSPPTSDEQRAIAAALSDVDALLAKLDQLITKKRDLKLAAMQQLLTGQIRLPGFSGEWSVKRLGEIGEALIGLTYSPSNVKSDGLLVLRSSNIYEGRLRFEDNVYVDIDVPEKIIVRNGDILICVRNGSRELIGKCALINTKSQGLTFGAFMAVFRTPFHPFVFHQFQSDMIKRQIHEHLGATINQITNKSLNSFRIPFPLDAEEQTAIATVLSDMDAEITTLEARSDKTKDLKQGMMQELLTGRTRLV